MPLNRIGRSLTTRLMIPTWSVRRATTNIHVTSSDALYISTVKSELFPFKPTLSSDHQNRRLETLCGNPVFRNRPITSCCCLASKLSCITVSDNARNFDVSVLALGTMIKEDNSKENCGVWLRDMTIRPILCTFSSSTLLQLWKNLAWEQSAWKSYCGARVPLKEISLKSVHSGEAEVSIYKWK